MNTIVCCRTAKRGVHSFYIVSGGKEYFLFNQGYRKGVQEYFGSGVSLSDARNFSKAHKDSAVVRTMDKLPMYIRYIEKAYGLEILEQTKKHNTKKCSRFRGLQCA